MSSPWGVDAEGETPIPDRLSLKDQSISNRQELDIAEAANIQKAALKYLAARPSTRTAKFADFYWFLELHKEMFGDVWAWAGNIRTIPLNIGIAPAQIGEHLARLVEDLKYWGDEWDDKIQVTAYLHHRAVQIHPFLNGNGRWSRMLANIWLRFNDHPIIDWPHEVGKLSPIRKEYLAAIRDADQGSMAPLIELHRKYTPAKSG